jgi:hypothetical protein
MSTNGISVITSLTLVKQQFDNVFVYCMVVTSSSSERVMHMQYNARPHLVVQPPKKEGSQIG